MSEYQYYEFQAIDRPLTAKEQAALRALSTRARISSTSFTNHYEWGDFKGDPAKLMDDWFDLHLYLANWGSRRLMIRLPARMVERHRLDAILSEVDCAAMRASGRNLILDIAVEEVDSEDWDDGSGWLAAVAPLRADVLGGDLRLFYLLWLTAVEADVFEADEPEPLRGIGPMTGPLAALANFLDIDPDLVAAAAERSCDPVPDGPASAKTVRTILAAMTSQEKNELLVRVFDGDVHVANELRALVRHRLTFEGDAPQAAARSVGELRARAQALRHARERTAADKAAAERKRADEAAAKSRRARIDAVARRGESVWHEIEVEIERRNAAGYDKAASLLSDLRAIAEDRRTVDDFARRLRLLRERHARKGQFLARVATLA